MKARPNRMAPGAPQNSVVTHAFGSPSDSSASKTSAAPAAVSAITVERSGGGL